MTSPPISTFPPSVLPWESLDFCVIDAEISISGAQSRASNSCSGINGDETHCNFFLSIFSDFFPSLHLPWSNFPFGLVPTVVAHYLIFLSPFIIYIFRGFCHLWSSAFGWMNTANGLVGFAVFCRRAKLGDSTLGWFCHPPLPAPYSIFQDFFYPNICYSYIHRLLGHASEGFPLL